LLAKYAPWIPTANQKIDVEQMPAVLSSQFGRNRASSTDHGKTYNYDRSPTPETRIAEDRMATEDDGGSTAPDNTDKKAPSNNKPGATASASSKKPQIMMIVGPGGRKYVVPLQLALHHGAKAAAGNPHRFFPRPAPNQTADIANRNRTRGRNPFIITGTTAR
jgi:hypothetical protein